MYSFEKNLFIFFKFFLSIIRQKPTPQLNVLSISLSDIPLFLSQQNILEVLISSKFIFAESLSGIILLILSDNIKRIIPDKLSANINLGQIKTSKIFNWLKNNGISDKEMLKTFNCGVGFCLIIERKNLKKIDKFFSKEYKPYVIGKISEDKNKVNLNGSINWL